MTSHQPPASRLLFDGDCAFCTSAAEWARRRIRPRVPIVAWQGEIDTLPPLAVGMAQEAVVFMDGDTPVASGATAVAFLLGTSNHGWARVLGAVLTFPGVCLLAQAVYGIVARNRHRLPGGSPACELPRS